MFKYSIEGLVTNGEGLVLAIYDSDQGLDGRTTTKIQNGKFLFQGTAEFIKEAYLRFEDTVGAIQGYSKLSIYIEPGSIALKFDVIRRQPDYYGFSNFKVIEGRENSFVRSFFKDCKQAFGDQPIIITSDPVQAEELQRNLYPKVRSRVLDVFDQYFEKDVSDIHLYLLKWMVDQLRIPGIFGRDQLNREEVKKIKGYFHQLDTSLEKNRDYRRVKAKVDQIDNFSSTKEFVDYELEDIDGTVQSLSQLVTKKQFTILNFWSSGCAPCRVFHKEISAEYEELKQNGVEFISINVDDSKISWKKSSTEDGILWPNLYAGQTTTILDTYRIRGFPAKIVYDQNMKFIDIRFRNKKELWDWVNTEVNRK